ncbi:MAG: ABC transporter substrate-binding protein [Bacteroidaceae bacterium]|nr:ABC transporter substrate-binding protein [Bacteroidaceae bacterium]
MKQVWFTFLVLLGLCSCSPERAGNGWQYAMLAPSIEGDAFPQYDRILAASAVHASLLRELGAGERIVGVCDANFIVGSELREADLRNFGSYANPDVEQILVAGTDALMLSPVAGSSYGAFGTLGLPIIECKDYLESTPLGRAEWMRYYGRLVGHGTEADSLFACVCMRYQPVSTERPFSVLTDLPQNGQWYVPGGKSYLASLYADAGYTLPCSAHNEDSGSLCLTIEQVLALGASADLWLIKYAAPVDLTLEQIAREYPFAQRIKAFREGRVLGCNTLRVPYYEQIPFHPDLLLNDLTHNTHIYYQPLR